MNSTRDCIIGVAIGDALGVPVEFESRESLDQNPVVDMREFGVYNQPRGTWSDDTSLTLCLAESLADGYDLERIAKSFLKWKNEGVWTAHGKVFDIGVQTHDSLNNVYRIIEDDPECLKFLNFEASESSNGNGSLMRILPLYFFLKNIGIENNFQIIWEVSALTHPHIRSAISCLMYLIMVDELLQNKTIKSAYKKTQSRMRSFFENSDISEYEISFFDRIVFNDISTISRDQIRSGGYVIDSLEASFWCTLKTSSYDESVLMAVNLGEDTDTTAAITGGMTGVFYGIDTASHKWYESVARIADIESICDKLEERSENTPENLVS